MSVNNRRKEFCFALSFVTPNISMNLFLCTNKWLAGSSDENDSCLDKNIPEKGLKFQVQFCYPDKLERSTKVITKNKSKVPFSCISNNAKVVTYLFVSLTNSLSWNLINEIVNNFLFG